MVVNLHQIKSYLFHFLVAKRKGHGVHSPFAYQLCEEVFYNSTSFYDFEYLSKIRKQLLLDETVLEVEDFGAGSKKFKKTNRKVSEIARHGISNQKQSEIFYRLINFLESENIVELGSSLGLNTLYLAHPNKNNNVISIEGSIRLHEFAKHLALKSKINTIKFIHAKFDEALPKVLSELETLDCFYVDGNHSFEATVNYFNTALTKRTNNTVFIFDDIYWSKGMTKAWHHIKKDSVVKLSIDAFYFGLIFFKEEIKEKVDLRFYL